MTGQDVVSTVRRLLRERGIEEFSPRDHSECVRFATEVRKIDGLTEGGIPSGQLVEISGDAGCGKTALLSRVVACLTKQATVAYIDFHHCFFPAALAMCNVDLHRLFILRPSDQCAALRAAERFLRGQTPACIVFDLVGESEPLPMILLHRLRQQVVRAGGLVIFLTEGNSSVISPSTVALRLVVRRVNRSRVAVAVDRSRLCAEGVTVEVDLDA